MARKQCLNVVFRVISIKYHFRGYFRLSKKFDRLEISHVGQWQIAIDCKKRSGMHFLLCIFLREHARNAKLVMI